jgi:hypothetical protein
MDKNLFFIDDRKMQQNALTTMAAIQAELDRRNKGAR